MIFPNFHIMMPDLSNFLVSCETPIQWEQFSLVCITNTCSIWYFVRIAIFEFTWTSWSLLVHLQFIYFLFNVYLSIVVCTNLDFFIHARDPKQSYDTPAGELHPTSWGVKTTLLQV